MKRVNLFIGSGGRHEIANTGDLGAARQYGGHFYLGPQDFYSVNQWRDL